MRLKRWRKNLLLLLTAFTFSLTGCSEDIINQVLDRESASEAYLEGVDLDEIPEYSGSPYVVINDNVPDLDEEDLTTESFEYYSDLDSLGRCGTAIANIGQDLMPTEERGSIGNVKPTGWQTAKYDVVEGKYLYNRCHLIGYQLTAENANKKNLITGTRYLNIAGMLPFENMVADFIKETGEHVLYKVTPVFEGNNLVADGVQIQAESVEDDGDGIMFNVYCYNVQPEIEIDYATGNSSLEEEALNSSEGSEQEYIVNTNTGKFHDPGCSSAKKTSEMNKKEVYENREQLISEGYVPCGSCKP